MRGLLDMVMHALRGGRPSHDPARALLLAAQRARTPVELQLALATAPDRPTLTCTIEHVRRDDLLISQPLVAGRNHPLAIGEGLVMAFVSPRGRVIGRTRSLGRIKVPSGGARPFFGYRLSLPLELVTDDRREHHRVPVGFDLAPEAELFTRFDRGPVRGVVEDLSIGGARIRSRNARGRIAPARRAYVKISLPPPINELGQMVTITHIEPGRDPEVQLIGLEFETPVAALTDFLRQAQQRRRRRERRFES
jgi:hypothetical protein